MTTTSDQKEPSSHNTSKSSATSRHKTPASDCGKGKYPGKHNTPYLTLALAITIPALLIAALGSYFLTQKNSLSAKKPSDPEALYKALEQKMTLHGSAFQHAGDVESAIQLLQQRLAKNPNDAEGWRVLGWSHFKKQEFKKAAHAYRKATKLDTGNAMLHALYGEALVAAASGQVTPKATAIFKTALTLDPNNIRAGFYSGQAKLQQGDAKSALSTWRNLLKKAPQGESWTNDLRIRILEVSHQSGIDPQLPTPIHPKSKVTPGPTTKDIENASRLTPQERQTMVNKMVERLAKRLNTSPNDPDGWIMLIRSRVVLNDSAGAKSDLKRALDIFAKNPDITERLQLTSKDLHLSLTE